MQEEQLEAWIMPGESFEMKLPRWLGLAACLDCLEANFF